MGLGMRQGGLVPELQQIAKQILRISKRLNEIYQDQFKILGHLNAQNMFKIHQDSHQIALLNDLFHIEFVPACTAEDASSPIIRYDFSYQGIENDAIRDFIFQEIYFLTGDLKPQNSLLLRNKAKHFRQLLLNQTYAWVDGAQRVRHFFQNISLVQAEIIDHLMLRHQHYQHTVLLNYIHEQKPIPEDIMHLFCQMFSLDVLCGDKILPLQNMIESLDAFCFSAAEFLPPSMYRIIEVNFEERFNLHELIEQRGDIQLLYRHAEERGALLGFMTLIHRELWQNDDILAKYHFLDAESEIWQKKVARLPIFDYPRGVNWLFKQSVEVIDWLSGNIQHSSVRVAVTALSFIDSSRIHPQVILATLHYFQYSCARMFIHSCHRFAMREDWFGHPSNRSVLLKDHSERVDDHRIAISPSILYLDEWTGLMCDVLGKNDQAVKRVYSDLSRVMQAYMLHLDKITQQLPADLMPYIRVETQQNRGFLSTLRRHQIQLNDFRQLFYLQDEYVRESIFDTYVRDYLADYFAQNKPVPKNVTWMGLFVQATQWHDYIQKQEILSKLRKSLGGAAWKALTEKDSYDYQGWQFSELKNLDQIINESKLLKHCLAASYAIRIVEGEYVAFHMSHGLHSDHLTLGCHVRAGQLIVDQLEFANNQKAGVEHMHVAVQFIQCLNKRLAENSGQSFE